MKNPNFLDVITEAQARTLDNELSQQLRDLCVHIKRQADLAWDACADARAVLNDVTAEYHRGRAHAFCEVLGDQANLSRLIDGFAPTNDQETT